MTEYAFAIPVVPEHLEEWRKAAVAIEGERHGDHRAMLQRSGIWLERAWLQRLGDGGALTVVYWDCDDVAAASTWRPDSEMTDYERWFRDVALGTYHGIPTDAAWDTFNRCTVDVRGAEGESVGAYAFAAPIMPGQLAAWEDFCTQITTGSMAAAHRELLAESHVHRERVFLQAPPPEMPDAPPLAIVCWDCDDAHLALEILARGDTEHARYMRDVVVTQMHGMDLSAGLPPLNELLGVTHVRRTDGMHPHEKLLRRGYAAFAEGDMATLTQLIAADTCWVVDGTHPLARTYNGRDDLFGFFAELAQRTMGSLQISIADVYCNDGGCCVVTDNRAERDGTTYDIRYVACYDIADGQVAGARVTPCDAAADAELFG